MTLDELFDRVVFCPSGCWIWTGADSGTGRGGGYGKIRRGSRWYYVHRLVYQELYGPIPYGYQVDHLCKHWGWNPLTHRRCCNPDHLEAVPAVINQRRKYDKANI